MQEALLDCPVLSTDLKGEDAVIDIYALLGFRLPKLRIYNYSFLFRFVLLWRRDGDIVSVGNQIVDPVGLS